MSECCFFFMENLSLFWFSQPPPVKMLAVLVSVVLDCTILSRWYQTAVQLPASFWLDHSSWSQNSSVPSWGMIHRSIHPTHAQLDLDAWYLNVILEQFLQFVQVVCNSVNAHGSCKSNILINGPEVSKESIMLLKPAGLFPKCIR